MSPPLKVGLVTPRFPPDVGGLESYVGWLASALRDAADFDVVVVSTHPGKGTQRETWNGVDVIRLGSAITVSNTPVHPAWPVRLRRVLREERVDVVNAHAPVPGLADVVSYFSGGAPVVLTYHAGSLVKGVGGPVDAGLRAYERWVLPRVFARCAALVAVSPVAMTHHTGRAQLISPGVDPSTFRPPSGDEQRRGILYVGRIETTSRWKGVSVLVDALAGLAPDRPDLELHLVGGGDGRAELERQASRMGVGDRIVWHGALDREHVAAAYRRAAVTVLPSLTEAESFGMVLVEAMASGCPVIGSEVGGIPYVVRDGVDGLLAPRGDPSALAAAIERVLDDPALATSLGDAGRQAAETRWSWDHQVERSKAVLRSVAATSG